MNLVRCASAVFPTLVVAALVSAAGLGAPGDLYVAVGQGNLVLQLDSATGASVGNFVASGSGGLATAVGVAWGPNGNLFVSSYTNDRVLQYDGNTGAFINVFATGGGLDGPYGLTFGPDGNLYVCSSINARVVRFDGTSGAAQGTFAIGGTLAFPSDLVFGPNGNLFVSSNTNSRVIQFDGATGAVIGTFASGGGLSSATGLTFGPNGNLFVASYNNDQVIQYNGTSGAVIGTFASGGGLDGAFGIAFGVDGNLYASGYLSNNIVKYDGGSGAPVGVFAAGVSKASHLKFKPILSGFPHPDVTGFAPMTATNCGTVAATIDGSGYVTGLELRLKQSGQPDILGSIVTLSPTQVTANFYLAGVALGTWDVEARYPDGQSDALPGVLNVTACAQPQVTGISPSPVSNCQSLIGATISGQNLVTGATVTLTMAGQSDISGTAVIVSGDGMTLTANFAITGVAAGIWDVAVLNPGGTGADTLVGGLEITACPPPLVTGMLPNPAANCTSLTGATITGSNFRAGALSKLSRAGQSDINGTNIVIDGGGATITANFNVANAAPGDWDIVVTNPAPSGVGSLAGGLSIIACPPPVVTGISPNTTTNCGTLSDAIITGSNFKSGSSVKLARAGSSDISGTSVSVLSATSIRATFNLSGVPVGAWDVVVTRPDGQSGAGVGLLATTLCPPGITSVTPISAINCRAAYYGKVAGVGLVAQTTLKLTRSGEADILGFNPRFEGSDFGGSTPTIFAFFDMSRADVGSTWDMVATNPNGESSTYPNAVIVRRCGQERDLFVLYGEAGGPTAYGRIYEFDGADGEFLGAVAHNNWPPPLDSWAGKGSSIFLGSALIKVVFGGPQNNLFVSTADEMNLVLEYDGRTGALVRPHVLRQPGAMATRGDGSVFVATRLTDSIRKIVRLDLDGGQTPTEFADITDLGIVEITFGPNGNLYTFGDNQILQFDGQSGANLGVFIDSGVLAGRKVRDLEFHPATGHLLALVGTSDSNSGVAQFDGTTGVELAPLVAYGEIDDLTEGFAVGPNGNFFIPNERGVIKEFDGGTGAFVRTFSDYYGAPVVLRFKPDLGPFPAPTLSGLIPPTAENCGWAVDMVVSGSGIVQGGALKLTNGVDEIPLQWTSNPNGSSVVVRGYFGGATPGLWDLVLEYPDGQSAVLSAAISVSGCPGLSLATVSPAVFDNCMSAYGMLVTGGGLVEGTAFRLIRADKSDIVGKVLAHPTRCCGDASTSEMRVDFGLSDAPIGTWDLVATNPWGQSATLTSAVRIIGCASEYTFFDLLGRPGSARNGSSGDAAAEDINNAGTICGSAYGQGFSWANGALTLWSEPDQYASLVWPVGISETGIVATYAVNSSHSNYAAVFDGSTIQFLPSACEADIVNSISPNGSFVGGHSACPQYGSNIHIPVVWSLPGGTPVILDPPPFGTAPSGNGELNEVPAINDDGTTLLNYRQSSLRRLFICDADKSLTEITGELFGLTYPIGRDMNGSKSVVGSMTNELGQGYGFRYIDGAITDIWRPGSPNAINVHNIAVGSAGRGAALFAIHGNVISLSDLYMPPAMIESASFSDANGINDRGWIVGYVEVGGRSDWTGFSGVSLDTFYPWLLRPNLKGDLNQDGDVNSSDIQGFVDVLFGAEADPGQRFRADIDRSGEPDTADLPLFVDMLLGVDRIGACCLPDATCVEAPQRECIDANGAWRGESMTCVAAACNAGDYLNVNPTSFYIPGRDLQHVADDMTLSAGGSDALQYIELSVFGWSTFDVTVELYIGCPLSGVLLPVPAITWTGLPGGAPLDLSATIEPPVTIPDSVWMVATFSAPDAGWIIGNEAEVGFTENQVMLQVDGELVCDVSFVPPNWGGLLGKLRCRPLGPGELAQAFDPRSSPAVSPRITTHYRVRDTGITPESLNAEVIQRR